MYFKVVYFNRKPSPGAYSIEKVFDDVRSALPDHIDASVFYSRFRSTGVWRRIYNIFEACWYQGDVNHIAGDVHFLTYLMRRRCTVLTILDCVNLERLSGMSYWVYWIFWYWIPLKRAGTLTAISESTKNELLKHVDCDPSRIHVIHCTVSANFRPYEKKFNHNKPVILQVGTTENKNIVRVAQALKGIPCKLVVIGKLSNAQIEALNRNNIECSNLHGLTERELLEQYRLSDMLIFASTYEGFGMPIIEANAVGRPVVTSNLYSMPEVAGTAACLVDPHDVASIREGILRIINDAAYRDHLISEGFRNIERFRPVDIASQYAELYEQVFKANSGVARNEVV